MRVPKGIVPFALLLGLGAAPLHSQQQGPGAEFSLGGGIGFPLSDFDDIAKLGWHGLAGVSVVPTGWPVGIQVDGQYHQFKLDESSPAVGPGSLKDRLIFGTADIVYKFQTAEGSTFRPYLIGGGGVYNLKTTGSSDVGTVIDTDNSQTKFGINAGAGFDFKAGSAGLFVEGRFHDVFTRGSDLQFVPVTIGVRLGGQ
jgi:Outer membrane protein beta-barrel domain